MKRSEKPTKKGDGSDGHKMESASKKLSTENHARDSTGVQTDAAPPSPGHSDSADDSSVADWTMTAELTSAMGLQGPQATEPTATPIAPDKELQPNQRVLTRDPTYAQASFVPWFQDQCRTKLTGWGLVFDPAAVQFDTVKLDGVATPAVVLTWSASWGTIPVTRDFPLTLAPLDAPAAVTAVSALPGWAKLSASEQGLLRNLLGGESNQLSSSVRNHLRPIFAGLATKNADEQATALKGELQIGTSSPGWSSEPMGQAIATVVVAGPVEKKNYAFTGSTVDGEEWTATFNDGIVTKIMAPKAPTVGHHNHSVQEIAAAACYVPKPARAVITLIVLNPVVNPDDAYWAVEYHQPNFHSYMTAGVAGVVTVYPDKVANALPDNDGRRSAIVHETAHTWSYKTWGEDKTQGKWLQWQTAMTADVIAVSGYATAAIAEDVAETVRVYVSTKGTPRFEEYKNMVPHRFAMLATEYAP